MYSAAQHKHQANPILNTNYRHKSPDTSTKTKSIISQNSSPSLGMLGTLRKEKWDIYRAYLPTQTK